MARLLQCSLLLVSRVVYACYCSPDTEDISVGPGGVPVESEGMSTITGTMSVASLNRDDVTKMDTPPSVRKGGGAGRRRGNFRIPPTSFQSFNPNGVLIVM